MNQMRLGLKARVITGFVIAMATLMLLFAGSYYLSRHIDRVFNRLQSQETVLRMANQELNDHILILVTQVATAFSAPPFRREEHLATVYQMLWKINEVCSVIRNCGIESSALAPLSELAGRLDRTLSPLKNAELAEFSPSQQELARQLSVSLAEEGRKLGQIVTSAARDLEKRQHEQTRKLSWLILLCLAAGFTIALAVPLFICNSLVRRIGKLRKQIQAVAGGEFTVTIADRVNDELGDMSLALQDLAEKLSNREKALNESEEHYRLLVEAAFEGIVITEQGIFLDANQQLADMLGYELPELVGRPVLEFIAPEDRPLVSGHMCSGYELPYENRLIRKDGSIITVLTRARHYQYRGRQVWVTVLHDITERKKAVEALKEREQRYRTFFDNAPISLWEEDFSAVKEALDEMISQGIPDLRSYLDAHPEVVIRTAELIRIVDINDATLRLYGARSKNELYGNITRVLAPDSLVTLKEILVAIATGKDYIEAEAVNRRLNGELIDIIIKIAIPAKDSEFGDLLIGIVDITDRKRMEEALQESEKKYRDLVDLLPQTVFECDLEMNLTYVNQQTYRIFGYTEEDFRRGLNIRRLLAPEEEGRARENAEQVLRGEKAPDIGTEYIAVKKEGTPFPILVYSSTLLVAGRLSGLRGIAVDISSHKLVEEALLVRDRAIASSINGIAMADLDGTITFANNSFLKMWGYGDKREVLGRKADTFWLHRVEMVAAIDHVQEHGTWSGEMIAERKDGTTFIAQISGSVVRDAAGIPLCLMASFLDITKRKLAEDALQRSEELLRTIIRHAPIPISINNIDGSIDYLNDRFVTTFGYCHDDIPNLEAWWLQAYPDAEYRRSIREGWQVRSETARRLGRDIEPYEVIVTCKDGTQRNVEVFGTTVGDRDIVILNDITDKKLVAEKLHKAKEEAETANRAKSQFLANMSHEIRTPLTAIIGFTELIQQADATTDISDYLKMICTSGESLLSLVDDILDLAKIEAEKFHLEPNAFDLREVLEQSASPQAALARQKGVGFTIRVAPDIPLLLWGDGECLRQILTNLCNNAVKFTEQGEIVLAVTLETTTAESETVHSPLLLPFVTLHFTISDTGIGIPADKQTLIFESFTQADGSTTRKFGGTGLGTTIAKRMVELMGGTIRLESTPGAGTTFHIVIGFETRSVIAPPCQGPLANVQASFQQTLEKNRSLNILIAEDNPVTQRLLADTLRHHGHRVSLAENGSEVIDVWERESYDLILMDVQMPGMNGLDTTIEIRRREKNRGGHVPIIAVTANALMEDRELCLAAGMDEFLTKPFNVGAFLELLHGGPSSPIQPGIPPHADVSFLHGIAAHFNMAGMPTALWNDKACLDEYIHLFLRDVGRGVSRIENAIGGQDPLELARAAHAVKGAVVHLKNGRLRDLSAKLEELGESGRCAEAGKVFAALRAEYDQLKALLGP